MKVNVLNFPIIQWALGSHWEFSDYDYLKHFAAAKLRWNFT